MQNAIMKVSAEGTPAVPVRDDTVNDALDAAVALHGPRIRKLVHRLLGWRTADVDDVVQDVFLAALTRGPLSAGGTELGKWLMTVAINRCRTHHRRRLVRFAWLRRQRPDAAAPLSVDDEKNSLVRSALQQLRPADREVIVLFHLESMSIKEIAPLLQISAGAVEVRLHRARARMKQVLLPLMADE